MLVKGVPPGTLLSKLVNKMILLLDFFEFSEVKGILIFSKCVFMLLDYILLWNEFIKKLRWHWENSILIPSIFFDFNFEKNNNFQIDFKYCIIFQKIQLVIFK